MYLFIYLSLFLSIAEVLLKQKHLTINKLSVICGMFFTFFLLMFFIIFIKKILTTMKKLIIFFFLVVSASYSQTSDALKLCVALQNNFTSNYEANNAVDKILSVIGTSQKPILQPCSNINNAVAASYKGQRYILYDKDFMESLTVGRNKYWSNMFILAHEVGHHIN